VITAMQIDSKSWLTILSEIVLGWRYFDKNLIR
jgi:hypothetical protein